MNFAALKEFRKTQATGIKEVVSYLADELSATIRELRAGLQRLTFGDNFAGFTEVLTIPANTELTIPNKLGSIPSYWIILRKDVGGLSVSEGATAWTLETVTLKNNSLTVAANITVRFFK